MAKKFEIIGAALVVTDTITSKVLLDMPSNNAYHNYEQLRDNDNIRIYDNSGTNFRGTGLVNSLLVDSVDFNGVTFTEETFLKFSRGFSKSQTFTFGDGEDHDATVTETSDSISTPNNFNWNIIPESTGVVGDATYTIEVSNDNVVFINYAETFIDLIHEDGAEDDFLTYNFIRIEYKAGTVSAGTIKFPLTEID